MTYTVSTSIGMFRDSTKGSLSVDLANMSTEIYPQESKVDSMIAKLFWLSEAIGFSVTLTFLSPREPYPILLWEFSEFGILAFRMLLLGRLFLRTLNYIAYLSVHIISDVNFSTATTANFKSIQSP